MKKLISIVTTFATIIGLTVIPALPLWLKIIIGVFACFSFGYLVYIEYIKESDNEVVCKSDSDIKSCMKEIIKMPGKICIMSRDLSWVDDDIQATMLTKADSILIFAQNKTDLTEKLQNYGIEIVYYGNLGFEPKTRFTMIRYNKNNPQVAIANTQNSIRRKGAIKHVIYQTQKGKRTDEWINSLAGDMIMLCKAACREDCYDKH